MFIPINVDQLKQEEYISIPTSLFGESYDGLSTNSMITYGLLRSRAMLSFMNNWFDEAGNVFVIYTRKQLMDKLKISDRTATKIFQELVEFDLIQEESQGMGRPNLIFIGTPQVDSNAIEHKKAKAIAQDALQIYVDNTDISPEDVANEPYKLRPRTVDYVERTVENTVQNRTSYAQVNRDIVNREKDKKTAKAGLRQNSKQQNTLLELPKQKIDFSKLSQYEQGKLKVELAIEGNLEWKKVSFRDFTHYFIYLHNEVFELREISFDRYSSVGIIRDSFIARYEVPLEKVPEMLEQILTLYSQSPDCNGILTFNMIDKARPLMDELVRRATPIVFPVERKYGKNDTPQTVKRERNDFEVF